MKFAVLSDTHYLSESMLLPGASEEAVLKNKIPKSVFKMLETADGVDTVLLTGDLTHAGDRQSHLEYIDMLRALKARGKRVLALTATHDFQFSRAFAVKEGWPVRYKDHPWYHAWFDKDSFDYKSIVKDEFRDLPDGQAVPPFAEVCTPEELWDLYYDFGPAEAFSVFLPDYSYAVRLDDKTWCLMLNNNFRDVDPMENMSASYSPGCLKWIAGIVRDAKKTGAFVFACTHHPLVPPVPAYKIGGTDRNMRKAYVGHMLADVGVPLVFSGHTHFADVGFLSSDAGNILCDVTTPGLSSLPPAYRLVDLDGQNGRLRLSTPAVPNDPAFGVTDETMRAWFERRFIEEYAEKVDSLPLGLGKLVRGLKVRHLYPLCRGARLTKAEYAGLKDVRMFDLIMRLVVNMQCGDGDYTPDTPVYRFMMAFAAATDSVVDAFPFVDLRKKLLGYTVAEIVEPMLFNNFVPDNEADFDFTVLPAPNTTPPRFKSRLGDVLMVALLALAFALSPLSKAAAVAFPRSPSSKSAKTACILSARSATEPVL